LEFLIAELAKDIADHLLAPTFDQFRFVLFPVELLINNILDEGLNIRLESAEALVAHLILNGFAFDGFH
jgi:hypothetical protein